jgi:hypothetical protein
MGLMPNNFKPVSTVERGAYEIRVSGRRWHCSADVRGQVPRHDLRPSRVHNEVAEERYRYRQEALPGDKRWLTACSTTSLTLQRRRQTSPARHAHDRDRAADQGGRLDADRGCRASSSHPTASLRPSKRKDQQVQPRRARQHAPSRRTGNRCPTHRAFTFESGEEGQKRRRRPFNRGYGAQAQITQRALGGCCISGTQSTYPGNQRRARLRATIPRPAVTAWPSPMSTVVRRPPSRH